MSDRGIAWNRKKKGGGGIVLSYEGNGMEDPALEWIWDSQRPPIPLLGIGLVF